MKSPMMHRANEYLRQARRCEALGHRIIRGREEGEEKRKTYRMVNREAVVGIKKALDKGDKEDEEFRK